MFSPIGVNELQVALVIKLDSLRVNGAGKYAAVAFYSKHETTHGFFMTIKTFDWEISRNVSKRGVYV